VELKSFALALNKKWKNLIRKFKKVCADCASTAIYTDNAFVVPGGRFIEYYYWDTYWIVEGLLVCNMTQTVKGLLQNFLDIIETNGFVPNGARAYYLNRSQPPLLTQMIYAYVKKTNDMELLQKAIDYLDAEYSFWMTEKVTKVEKNGKTYELNMYNISNSYPRPESYKEDYLNALQSKDIDGYYSNVISAAESGWDFSSRWFENAYDITTIQIRDIIPVDLNAILFKNEKILSQFHEYFNNPEQSEFYRKASEQREIAINQILWSEEFYTWADFNVKQNKSHTEYLYPTDLTPLWAGITLPVDLNTILSRYKGLLMDHVSGIPSSNVHSGQQWDFPNVWAPYHHWIVEYLNDKHPEYAVDIAQRFVNTAYCSFKVKGALYEKYQADVLGAYGEGGEYVVQEGFGWTNGVVIMFMNMFGDKLKSTNKCLSNLATNSNARLTDLNGFSFLLVIFLGLLAHF
jgi:alpha,alpha-trehalase